MVDLRRLARANKRFEFKISILNALIVAVAAYTMFMLLGVTTYFEFYWRGTVLVAVPAALSALLGLSFARLIKRRSRSSIFDLLEGDLSEKAKTAYDNRNVQSLVMSSLAEEVKAGLSSVRSLEVVDLKRLHRRMAATALLVLAAVLISQTHIGAEITPADFQIIGDLKDEAMGLFLEEEEPQGRESESTGQIYGKPSLAVLGEANLELQLYPGTGAGSISRETAPAEHLFRTAPPGQGVAVPSDLYIESLPPQHREIIKRYFEALAKG